MSRDKCIPNNKRWYNIVKKWIILFILIIIPLSVSAEVSTNLKTQTVNVKNSKRLVESITYVDDEGNAVIPTVN